MADNQRPPVAQPKKKKRLTPAAKAQERKPVNEKLAQALNFRRQIEARTRQLQERFIDTSSITEQELLEASAYFTPEHYEDITVERALGKICGYPCCSKPLPPPTAQPKGKYYISVSQKRVFDLSELRNFCSRHCLLQSNLYKSKLDETPVHLRPQHASTSSVVERVEVPPPLEIPAASQSMAIEGYIPTISPSISSKTESPAAASPPPQEPLHQTSPRSVTTSGITRTRSISEEEEEEAVVLDYFDFRDPKKVLHALRDEAFSSDDDDDIVGELGEKDFKSLLSRFGVLCDTLNHWCTNATKQFLRGEHLTSENTTISTTPSHSDADEGEPIESDDDVSLPPVDSIKTAAVRRNLAMSMLNRQLPYVQRELRVAGHFDSALAGLVATFSFRHTLHALSTSDWTVCALVCLELLSRTIPALDNQLHADDSRRLWELLQRNGIRQDEFGTFLRIFD